MRWKYDLSDILEFVGGLGVLSFVFGIALALIGAGLRILQFIDSARLFIGIAAILVGFGICAVTIAFILMWRDEGW